MRVCVFCGSSHFANKVYLDAAKHVANAIIARRARLVYGGGSLGLMGVVAKTVSETLGKDAVLGIVPGRFVEEMGERIGVTVVVESIEERKLRMYENSDLFIALAGSYGTMEEIFAAMTQYTMFNSKKPVGLLNTNHYYDKLIEQFDVAVCQGFMKKENREALIVSDHPDDLLSALKDRWDRDHRDEQN